MTDKQIIIDGIDVSKCKYIDIENFEKPICHCISQRNECEMPCEYNKDCHYKQLKRKEQECEELKEEIKINGFGCFNIEMSEQLDQLKAENEELKTMLKDLSYENQKFCYQIEEQTKQLEPFKDEYFKGLDNVVIAELAKKSIRITAENSKLEQTLAEIKEIAEENIRIADLEGLNGVYRRGLAEQILQKISECEVNNAR